MIYYTIRQILKNVLNHHFCKDVCRGYQFRTILQNRAHDSEECEGHVVVDISIVMLFKPGLENMSSLNVHECTIVDTG